MTYWIVIDGVQVGPMSLDEILAHPALGPESPVWHDGLPDWTVASQVPELAAKFEPSPGEGTVPPVPPAEPESFIPPRPDSGQPFRYGDNGYGYGNGQYNGGGQQPGGNYNNFHYNSYNNAPNYYGPNPPMPPDPRNQHRMPPNYLAWAIVVTICCCQVFGIIAIVYAAQVSPAYYRGDYERAEKMSSNAALWIILSIVTGLIITPFMVLFNIMTAV